MFFFVRFSIATIFLAVRFAAAAEPRASTGPAVKLLEIGWKAATDNYVAAQEEYEQARHAAPQDVRVPFAMGLIAVRNHHLADASKYLDEALAGGKSLLPIRRTKIWIDVLQNNQDAAKSDILQLARILSADDASASRSDYQETARWLGAVINFYAGPGKGRWTAAELSALDAELNSTLKGPLATQFADGKTVADRQFADLQQQLTAATVHAKATNEAKLLDDRQKNEAALTDATSRRTQAEQELTQFRQEKNADAVENEFNQLSVQLKYLNAQRSRTESAQRAADKDSHNSNSKDQNRSQRESDSLEQDLRNLDSTMKIAKDRFNTVSGSVQQIRAYCQPREAEALKSKKLEAKYTNLKKQLEHQASLSDNTTSLLEAKVKSISTYAGIDLEEEKTRILATYEKK